MICGPSTKSLLICFISRTLKFPCDGNDNVSHTSGQHGIKKTNNNKEYCIKLHLHVKLILCEWKHEPPAWAEPTRAHVAAETTQRVQRRRECVLHVVHHMHFYLQHNC